MIPPFLARKGARGIVERVFSILLDQIPLKH